MSPFNWRDVQVVDLFLALRDDDALGGDHFGALLVALQVYEALVLDRFRQGVDGDVVLHFELVVAHDQVRRDVLECGRQGP